MRKTLMAALVLGSLAILTQHAEAKQITVKLSKQQVQTVCDGKEYCQKSCGSSSQYNCEFGCGPAGCGGTCLTCPTGQSRVNTGAVRAALTGMANRSPGTMGVAPR